MRKTITLFICFLSFLLGNNLGYSQSSTGCNAELSVEKNRSMKSTGKNGAFFTLELKNTSNSSKSYTVTSGKTKQPCKKSNNLISKSTNTKSGLNVFILSPSDIKSKSEKVTFSVNGGSTQKFYVKVEVPEGTPYDTWSCFKITAKSDNCSSNGAETILSAYVTNPSEE
jgi:hypothetical protein